MTIAEESFGDVTVLILVGTLMGEPEASEFQRRKFDLLEANRKKLVLDLSGLKLINSYGLGTLIAALMFTRKRGGDIRLASVSNVISHVIQTVQLDKIFEIFETVEEAVQSFQ